MAAKKTIVEEAFPGDVIGLYDSGNFKIGDTLTEGEVLHFKGIPRFSPEMFRYVNNVDPLKTKQLAKGLDQLMYEGVAQLFTKEFDKFIARIALAPLLSICNGSPVCKIQIFILFVFLQFCLIQAAA
jgi:peptide subunit release factor RF-3